MINNSELSKFEFVLTLEKNIVCQRFFYVKDYNPLTRKSLDLHETLKSISEEISDELKVKTFNYLSDNSDYIQEEDTETEESFQIQINLEEENLITRLINAKLYHPKVRYSVDIRPKLKRFLNEITTALSKKNLETEFLGRTI